MVHQSYRDVIVSNNPTLLTSGSPENLAVGQLGFFTYDPKKEQIAVTPNFSVHKAFQIIQGTPETPTNLLGAISNDVKRSKPIKGRRILSWEGRKAERGYNQKVVLGYDGVDTTKNLTAKCEESKTVFVKLSGGPIDQIFHTEGKGYVRQYNIFSGCCDDCGDDCAAISAEKMADDLVNQVTSDPIMSLGTRTGNKLIKVSKFSSAVAPVPDETCTEYLLSICDNGDDVSLGVIQAFYPGFTVVRKSRVDSISTYQMIKPATDPAPAAFSNAGLTTITDCDTCPVGYTAVLNNFAYEVTKQDAGNAAALAVVVSQYSITGNESVTRIKYEFGTSTYIVISTVALSAIAGTNEVQSVIATGGTAGDFTLVFDGETTAVIAYNATAAAVQAALEALSNINPGDVTVTAGPLPNTAVVITFGGQYQFTNVPAITVGTENVTDGNAVVAQVTAGVPSGGTLELLNNNLRSTCVITVPVTTAWAVGDTLGRFEKTYSITLNDSPCDVSRLADLQAAYPDLVIVEAVAGDCVRKFTTTVLSNCVPPDCPPDVPMWVTPDAFEGVAWTAAATVYNLADKIGVLFESAFVDRVTGECAFDFWNYDAEPIFIEVSEHSFDYNAAPTVCANEWPVTVIQEVKLPIGVGSRVREEEAMFKGYERKFRDPNPIVREFQDSVLQTNPNKFYDQYTLAFEYDYHQHWFSEKLTDSYRLEVYFQEGQGKAFEAAVNSYLASVGLDFPPVVL